MTVENIEQEYITLQQQIRNVLIQKETIKLQLGRNRFGFRRAGKLKRRECL